MESSSYSDEPTPSSRLACDLAGVCSGCPWIGRAYGEQTQAKLTSFREQWKAAGLPTGPGGSLPGLRLRSAGEAHLRDRTDVVFRNVAGEARFGFYARESRELLAVGTCPQMSAPLQAWFDEVRSNPPAIQVGSLRLRVSPEGQRGVWLDFANTDVKVLLEEGTWLAWLAERAIVEIGQKRKRLQRRDDRWALGPPELAYWQPTFLGDKTQALYASIGTFSQTGAAANRAIVDEFIHSLPTPVTGRWLELGAGTGNLTLPLAYAGATVDAVEIEETALDGLLRSGTEAGLADRLHIHRLSFQAPSERLQNLLAGVEGIVADPPRSGLLRFCEVLEAQPAMELPKYFIYVSCSAESLIADSVRLHRLGYRAQRFVVIDQFPQTPHAEYIVRFEREAETAAPAN